MAIIASYSLKGGVGKTTLAVNLAAQAARCGRRVLLWDLDPQAAATFLLIGDAPRAEQAQSAFRDEADAARQVVRTPYERLDLLAADRSLRALDHVLFGLGKRRRLAKLAARLAAGYDHVMLDCPPGLTETSEQMFRAADVVLVPVIPSPLAERAFAEVTAHLGTKRRAALLPVFSLVDRRRRLHRSALAAAPDWPVIPVASAIEAERGAIAASSPSGMAFNGLWAAIERRLAAR